MTRIAFCYLSPRAIAAFCISVIFLLQFLEVQGLPGRLPPSPDAGHAGDAVGLRVRRLRPAVRPPHRRREARRGGEGRQGNLGRCD